MFICRVCGTESDSAVCPMCGAFNAEDTSGVQQDRRERIARPPAPKNQPALLKDASPVFDPSAPAASPEEIRRPVPQQKPAQNPPADKADPLHRNAFTRPRKPVMNPQAAQSVYRPEQAAQNQPVRQPVYQQPVVQQPVIQQPLSQPPVRKQEPAEPAYEYRKPAPAPESDEAPVMQPEENIRPQQRPEQAVRKTDAEKRPPEKKPANSGTPPKKKKKPKPKPEPSEEKPVEPEKKAAPEPETNDIPVITSSEAEEAIWGTEEIPAEPVEVLAEKEIVHEEPPEEVSKATEIPAAEEHSEENEPEKSAEAEATEIAEAVESLPEQNTVSDEPPADEIIEPVPETEPDEDEYFSFDADDSEAVGKEQAEEEKSDEKPEEKKEEDSEAAEKLEYSGLRGDMKRAGEILRTLTGSSAVEAAELMLDDSDSGGLSLLIPAHLAAIVLAGLCGWRSGGESGVFSGVGSSIGAAAIAWLEHIIILSILTAMALISVKKSKKTGRVFTVTLTALLPLCVSTAPALASAFLFPALTVPFLAFGAGWSLVLIYFVLDKAGISGKKLGTLRVAAFMLVYILAIGFLAGQFI